MVHALETIHSLLRPGGRLVDIHPSGLPSPVTIRLGGRILSAGAIREEESEFVDFQRAELALAEAVVRGLFRWEKQGEFTYTLAAGSVDAMLAYLDAHWKKAIMTEEVRRRMDRGMGSDAPDKELLISRTVRISSLRPLVPG